MEIEGSKKEVGERIDKKIKRLCMKLADITRTLHEDGDMDAKEAEHLINAIQIMQDKLLTADKQYDMKHEKVSV